MNVNLKLKREKAKLKGKILYLCFCFAICTFSFTLSALAQDEGVELQHRPENITKGYHIVSFVENNGVKDKKDQKIDLPIIRSSETTETVETAETLAFATIMTRGLPIHMPSAMVGAVSTWDGWSEVDAFIIHHIYTFKGMKEIAGKSCAEVTYIIQAAQKSPDASAAPDQNVIAGDGRFLFDLNNGVILVHTWQINGSGLRADYAAVLNL